MAIIRAELNVPAAEFAAAMLADGWKQRCGNVVQQMLLPKRGCYFLKFVSAAERDRPQRSATIPVSPDGTVLLKKVAHREDWEGVWLLRCKVPHNSLYNFIWPPASLVAGVPDAVPPVPRDPAVVAAEAAAYEDAEEAFLEGRGPCPTCHGTGFSPYGCGHCGAC